MPPRVDTIDSVLLPTDGSTGALVGAERGLEFAAAVGADVHVLSVIDTSPFGGLSSLLKPGTTIDTSTDTETTGDTGAETSTPTHTDVDTDVQQAALEGAEAAVETVAGMATERQPALEPTTAVEYGTPYRAISRYVEGAGIDVIVMGTKGTSGLERIRLGSVTENVLRTVEVPVLAVPLGAKPFSFSEEMIDTVLLPTDGSDGAMRAVEWGVSFARTFDARVHTLHSADTSRFIGPRTPGAILATLERSGEDALEAVREWAALEGVTVIGTVANGPPVDVILDYAADMDADLIVIGTRGRSGIGRLLLGSVTENVLRNADLPVFCVPFGGE